MTNGNGISSWNWRRILAPAFVVTIGLMLVGCASQSPLTGVSPESASAAVPQPTASEITDTIQKLVDENQLLTKENARLKHEKEEAETSALIANRKEEMIPQLVAMFRTNSPPILMNVFGFQGTVLDFDITDLAYKTNTLFIIQELLMKFADGTGEVAVIDTGLDIDSGNVVFLALQQTNMVTAADLAKASGVDPAAEPSTEAPLPAAELEQQRPVGQTPTANNGSVDWKPNNDTVNSAYQAGIKVAGAGLLLWLTHLATQGN